MNTLYDNNPTYSGWWQCVVNVLRSIGHETLYSSKRSHLQGACGTRIVAVRAIRVQWHAVVAVI